MSNSWGSQRVNIGTCLVACTALALPAKGAVLEIGANVSTSVQELISGVPGSVTNNERSLADEGETFPLRASGDLTSTDLSGDLVSMGQAFSEVADPTELDQPNPEEFGIEVGCYSNAETVSYDVTGVAQEVRTIVFTRPGNSLAPSEITFRPDGTREIESRVFLSGAVILWSSQPAGDLSELAADLRVAVHRDGDGAALFETSLVVAQDESGVLAPVAVGPIAFEVVGLDALREAGVDDESLAVLTALERDGALMVVVIPEQEHAYSYVVTANQTFDLVADLSIDLRNAPSGTGVTATLGRPFTNLTTFIDNALPGVNGLSLQTTMNRVVSDRAVGVVVGESSNNVAARGGLCGVLGVETMAGGVLGLFAFGLWFKRSS